jgi:hypothetical protein
LRTQPTPQTVSCRKRISGGRWRDCISARTILASGRCRSRRRWSADVDLHQFPSPDHLIEDARASSKGKVPGAAIIIGPPRAHVTARACDSFEAGTQKGDRLVASIFWLADGAGTDRRTPPALSAGFARRPGSSSMEGTHDRGWRERPLLRPACHDVSGIVTWPAITTGTRRRASVSRSHADRLRAFLEPVPAAAVSAADQHRQTRRRPIRAHQGRRRLAPVFVDTGPCNDEDCRWAIRSPSTERPGRATIVSRTVGRGKHGDNETVGALGLLTTTARWRHSPSAATITMSPGHDPRPKVDPHLNMCRSSAGSTHVNGRRLTGTTKQTSVHRLPGHQRHNAAVCRRLVRHAHRDRRERRTSRSCRSARLANRDEAELRRFAIRL